MSAENLQLKNNSGVAQSLRLKMDEIGMKIDKILKHSTDEYNVKR